MFIHALPQGCRLAVLNTEFEKAEVQHSLYEAGRMYEAPSILEVLPGLALLAGPASQLGCLPACMLCRGQSASTLATTAKGQMAMREKGVACRASRQALRRRLCPLRASSHPFRYTTHASCVRVGTPSDLLIICELWEYNVLADSMPYACLP